MEGELYGLGKEHALYAMRPNDPAPPASAPYELRADWSERYVLWVLSQSEYDETPGDARPTHGYEIEFTSCVLDPQSYERVCEQELQRETVH